MAKLTTILLLLLLFIPINSWAKQDTENIDNTPTVTNYSDGGIAIKTNILYDILLIPSIEVELPISKSWSVAGECVFPWWTMDNGTSTSERCRLQLLNGNIEAKLWLGNRARRNQLTGWYCGLYSGAGLYDIEYRASGYQSDLFVVAGATSGYAHTLSRGGSFRMEYSFALGYMMTKYTHYESVWGADDVWHPVRAESGTYTWLGPTRLRVSLGWMIGQRNSQNRHSNKYKRGGVSHD